MIWNGKNYINGQFKQESETYENVNPATEEVLGVFPNSPESTVHEAVSSAREAFENWKRISRIERAEYMLKVAAILGRRTWEVAEAISLETGKNFNESIAEINEAIHMAQYTFGSGRTPQGEAIASELAEKDSYMLRKPKGVIAIISPFNFPIAIGGFWCAAPAMVEGNAVVLKPSEDAPYSSQLCAEIYDEAGLPDGVFNVVHGEGETGDALAHADVDHICFTGSAEVGQHIRKVAAESWHKTTSCEMGSKSAVVIFDDANMDLALDACLASALKLSGQRCVSSGRLIVQQGIAEEFAEKFVSKVDQVKTGNPFLPNGKPDGSMYYGPLINKQGMEKVEKYNEMVAKDPKATLMREGKRLGSKGYFMTPTIYGTQWRDVPYLKEEVFGPHVAIIPFNDIGDAMRIYNDTDFGLALGVVTEDFKKARIMRDECDAGMIYWNGGSIAAESHMAFGGVKKSGNGFPSAARTFRAVTHEISWTVNHGEGLSFPQGMK
jgi:aldehyde dehydrogenase (NAD+)